jgi:nucleoid DNA-binding protein
MGTTKIAANKIKTITKLVLANDLVKNLNVKEKDASFIINKLINLISDNLVKKKSIMLKNIGTLAISNKAQRKGVRNPITGKEMTLKARCVVSLKKTHKDKNKLKTSDLIDIIYNMEKENKIKYSIIQDCIHFFLDTIINVKNGNSRIEIRGLGVFYPTQVDAKWSRNPKTGEKVFVEKKIKLSFKTSKVINAKLNN